MAASLSLPFFDKLRVLATMVLRQLNNTLVKKKELDSY